MASLEDANQEIQEGLVEEDGNASKTSDSDDELAKLLKGALDDFDKPIQKLETTRRSMPTVKTITSDPPKSTKEKKGTKAKEPAFDPSMMREVDDIFKNMMTQDPVLKDHWEKLAESCSQAAQNGSEEDFEKSLQETLKAMSENVQSLPNNSDIPEEELAKIWSSLGVDGSEVPANSILPDIMPLVTNMMQNLLSKDILYPALKDLTDKYPLWLEENRSGLPENDLQRYEKQLELMLEVCKQFESESPDDAEEIKKDRFQKILTTMQKMQECGSPPKELVGDVPDFGSPDIDFSKIPGLSSPGSQCSIQ